MGCFSPFLNCTNGNKLCKASQKTKHFFSNTYADVQQRADTVWKFQRYYLVKDYQRRSALPPPFSLFLMFLQLFRTIFDFIRNWFETCKNQESTPSTNKEDEEGVIPGRYSIIKVAIFY